MSRSILGREQLGGLVAALAVVLLGSAAGDPPEDPPKLTPEVSSALDRISADSLKGHLSFLASDLLEGRGTPSRGLDLAAEYIAAQFRRAGLEPIGDDAYFQTAEWGIDEPSADDVEVVFRFGESDVRVPVGRISLRDGVRELDLRRIPLLKLGADAAAADKLPGALELKNKAILLEDPATRGASRPERNKAISGRTALRRTLFEKGAALLVSVDRGSRTGSGVALSRRMVPFPDGRPQRPVQATRVPELVVHDPDVIKRLDSLPKGETTATLSLKMAAAVRRTVKVRNVIGLLRGSDQKLRDTYVLVTAHYDHLGLGTSSEADKTFNGANDDGSGTVSVIELASALATLPARPKRSLVFMTFFGEERGLVGSRYYVKHPVVPLDQTVADVNLEQLGRTDASDGPQQSAASMTGFDYSSLGSTFQRAGQRSGVRVFKSERFSDQFFRASDNYAFAEKGIPAHTICVAYQYPDYHGLGDHWEKVDFANMARVDRMVALGLLALANDPERPRWNTANAKAATFARAAKK